MDQIDTRDPRDAAIPLLGLATTLTACGGGGGGSSSDPGDGGGTTVVAGVPSMPSDAPAARFLAQAGFAATDPELASVQANGAASWIDAQFSAPRTQSHWDWMVQKGWADPSFRNTQTGLNNTLWKKLIASPDVLRQRIVLALTEFFVVSPAGIPISWRQFSCAAYLDMLEEQCFGNFRSLLEAVTLSTAMGVYLNMRGNQRENTATGRVPDENYAREILQLFSIGLFELNPDGTLKLASGKPIETYDQSTITGLARVFTGWDFTSVGPPLTDAPDRLRAPMVHIASRFSLGEKRFLGTTIPASADGPTALRLALDAIFNHPNVGPFFGRQLIQRLVTSNPSPAYVGRVAAAFNDNGRGVRGDLKAVIRAVLLDSEAGTGSTSATWGMVREPIVRFIQWGRTFNATSPNDLWDVGDTSDPATRLGQSPLRSASVFNFFRPGYVPPNTSLAQQGLVAPELQITNESTVVGYANFMQTRIQSGIGDVKPNYATELAIAGDVPRLVDHVATRLAGGNLSSATLSSIKTAVGTISANSPANRVYAAIMLVMCSPEYLVQK